MMSRLLTRLLALLVFGSGGLIIGCSSSTPTGSTEPNAKQLSKEKMEPEKGPGGKKG
jgi:hypothetical protein